MKTIQDLETERLKAIQELNDKYRKEKEKLSKSYLDLNDFSFDIITDAKPTINGIRYAKRKAIFIHHLEKYFNIYPKNNEEEINDKIQGGNEVGGRAAEAEQLALEESVSADSSNKSLLLSENNKQ